MRPQCFYSAVMANSKLDYSYIAPYSINTSVRKVFKYVNNFSIRHQCFYAFFLKLTSRINNMINEMSSSIFKQIPVQRIDKSIKNYICDVWTRAVI